MFFARVLAAFRAASCNTRSPLVLTAFRALAEREAADLFLAEAWACRERARRDTACLPSRFNLRTPARERAAEIGSCRLPFLSALAALLLVADEAVPLAGGRRLTPALRALDSPMAIACFADLAPCLPSRMCSISSRTNSPACVLADFPSRLSLAALRIVSCSGILVVFRFPARRVRKSYACLPRRQLSSV
jgi:hypothetical protein